MPFNEDPPATDYFSEANSKQRAHDLQRAVDEGAGASKIDTQEIKPKRERTGRMWPRRGFIKALVLGTLAAKLGWRAHREQESPELQAFIDKLNQIIDALHQEPFAGFEYLTFLLSPEKPKQDKELMFRILSISRTSSEEWGFSNGGAVDRRQAQLSADDLPGNHLGTKSEAIFSCAEELLALKHDNYRTETISFRPDPEQLVTFCQEQFSAEWNMFEEVCNQSLSKSLVYPEDSAREIVDEIRSEIQWYEIVSISTQLNLGQDTESSSGKPGLRLNSLRLTPIFREGSQIKEKYPSIEEMAIEVLRWHDNSLWCKITNIPGVDERLSASYTIFSLAENDRLPQALTVVTEAYVARVEPHLQEIFASEETNA